MSTANAAEAERLIAELNEDTRPETLEEFTKLAAAAFEEDMRPVCTAIVSALHDGDLGALRDLRALLPHLLVDVDADPTLADLLAHQLGAAFLSGFQESPGAGTTANANFNPAQKRGAHGRWGSGGPQNPMALGPNISRTAKLLAEDLDACGIRTDYNSGAVCEKLMERLKVKKPKQAADYVEDISGASPDEAARIMAHIQTLFDMVPPRAAKGFPKFQVRMVDEPDPENAGDYNPPILTINRTAISGAQPLRTILFHEMGHYFHFHGPESLQSATLLHYRRRTQGEPLQNKGATVNGELVEFKRDSFFSDYAGRKYSWEPGEGQGSELIPTHLEHLASGVAGLAAKPFMTNAKAYTETMAVAFSIFYYGRTRK